MIRALLLVAILALAGCSGLLVKQAAKAVVGSSPSLDANIQAGKTNSQTAFGNTSNNDLKLIRPKARKITQSQDDAGVKAEAVENVVINEASESNYRRDATLLLIPSPLGLIVWPILLWLRWSFLARSNRRIPK